MEMRWVTLVEGWEEFGPKLQYRENEFSQWKDVPSVKLDRKAYSDEREKIRLDAEFNEYCGGS